MTHSDTRNATRGDGEIDRLMDERLSAADTPELLVGIHRVTGTVLATAHRHHIDDTDPVTDAPTIRALWRILVDYEPMLTWADAAIDAYVEESQLAQRHRAVERAVAEVVALRYHLASRHLA